MSKAKFALGAVIAAAAGVIAGILSAPKSGKETQADIKNAATKAKGTVVKEATKAKNAAKSKVNEVKSRAEVIIEDVKDKAEEVAEDVTEKANDLKARTERAAKSATKEFNKKPASPKKK